MHLARILRISQHCRYISGRFGLSCGTELLGIGVWNKLANIIEPKN